MLPILNQSLWRDEAFSALLSEKSPFDIIRLTMHDASPPFYYILLHYWILIFGNNEVVLRSLSFSYHLLTVLVIFLIARKFINSATGQFFVATVTLLNPFLLQYAFEARPYSLLAFLTVLAIYFITLKKNVLAGIALAFVIFTHNFGIFTFTAFIVWWLFINRKDFKIYSFVELSGFPLLALLIWGSVMWSQWIKVAQGFWIQQSTSSIFIHSFELYSKGDLSYSVAPLLYTFTLVLCFFGFSYWVQKEREKINPNILLIFFVAFVPTLITYLISAIFVPIYHERYLIATVPLLIFLVGYSLYKLFNMNLHLKNIIIAFVAIYIVLLVQASEQIVGISTKPAINYGVNKILSKAQTGDIIVPQSILNFLEVKYYVEKSGKNIQVYAYSQDGKIPFYIGSILFEPRDVIKELPKNRRIWQIKPDGGYELLR